MAAGKTVSLRKRQVEERLRTRTFERKLQRYIQQCGANHRDREQFRLTSPLLHRKSNDDDDRPDRQRDRRSNERKSAHDDRERWRRQLMNGSSCDFVKLAGIIFKYLVREPAKENQRRNSSPKAQQQ